MRILPLKTVNETLSKIKLEVIHYLSREDNITLNDMEYIGNLFDKYRSQLNLSDEERMKQDEEIN